MTSVKSWSTREVATHRLRTTVMSLDHTLTAVHTSALWYDSVQQVQLFLSCDSISLSFTADRRGSYQVISCILAVRDYPNSLRPNIPHLGLHLGLAPPPGQRLALHTHAPRCFWLLPSQAGSLSGDMIGSTSFLVVIRFLSSQGRVVFVIESRVVGQKGCQPGTKWTIAVDKLSNSFDACQRFLQGSFLLQQLFWQDKDPLWQFGKLLICKFQQNSRTRETNRHKINLLPLDAPRFYSERYLLHHLQESCSEQQNTFCVHQNRCLFRDGLQ